MCQIDSRCVPAHTSDPWGAPIILSHNRSKSRAALQLPIRAAASCLAQCHLSLLAPVNTRLDGAGAGESLPNSKRIATAAQPHLKFLIATARPLVARGVD